ncbi:hypothetical protein [Cellulomonas fengjieae]|uniref:Uncharacterized protein n=1 Tax=Cellulomonas fengjieae TaxID=2819978 RepID=A0ABS3SFE0_9CELL|nr:hypothetical protein [Cellulomonas fengjieae]MBO3084468.1 hypothetical protein [Cellulomonas fengjieae]QVI67195.1 hypothetical protein KG102_06350 [Cellulomonas fengjieae]
MPAADARPGPALAAVRHRLAVAPPDLFEPTVVVPALVADLAVELDGSVLDAHALARLDAGLAHGPGSSDRAVATRRVLVGLVSWLVLDPAVRADAGVRAVMADSGGATRWMLAVAEAVPAELVGLRADQDWVHLDEAREELARAFLRAAGVLPAGEVAAVAQDRWLAVSTAYQRDLVRAMAVEQARAEELERALADRKAKEAAAQYANY